MLHKLRMVLWHWLVGPFRHRRTTAFWLVTVLALGGTSAWLSIRDAQKVAAADEDALITPPGFAPSCDVISVHDGDTMKLDCGWDEAKPKIITVRLHCIDAPELSQEPWGKLARDHLRKISGHAVAIVPVEHDRHGRLVARVFGNGIDLGLQMVTDGFAPVYPKYCSNKKYYESEQAAHGLLNSIWAGPGLQQRPWEWRRLPNK